MPLSIYKRVSYQKLISFYFKTKNELKKKLFCFQGFKPDVTLDQLVAIAGSNDLVSYYESSNRLIQMSSRFVQLVSG